MEISSNQVIALLGPTNTGKSFVAIEKMLNYESGIFGFPLRLLAREVYDKLIKKVGYFKVALITGEERIVPSKPIYYVSTVEAMPTDISAEFVAVDEIQLCNDYERGHIFTEKLLYSRGNIESLFLGSDTMEPIIKKLFPYANLFNTFTVSEYNGEIPPYTFPIGVGDKQLGLLLTDQTIKKHTLIKQPYALTYIQPSPEWGVHSNTCFF